MTVKIDGIAGLTFADNSTQNVTALNASNITAGTLGRGRMFAGAVLQVVSTQVVGSFNTSSSSYVHATNQSISITSTIANSKFLVMDFTPVQLGDSDVQASTTLRSSVDSYVSDLCEHLHVGYSTANDGWRMTAPLTVLHSPSQPASTTITYRAYVKRYTGSDGVYYPDPWGRAFAFGFYVMEIAP
jgi:hypothetical protein